MINAEISLAITNSLINGSHNLQLARSSFKVKHVCNSLSWPNSIKCSPSFEKFLTENVCSSEPCRELMTESPPCLASVEPFEWKMGMFPDNAISLINFTLHISPLVPGISQHIRVFPLHLLFLCYQS